MLDQIDLTLSDGVGEDIDQDDLEYLLEKWLPRLKLSDWEVNIFFTDIKDIGGNFAQIEFDNYHQTADLKVLRLDLVDQISTPVTTDVETSIVHELLHLRLLDCCPDTDDVDVHLERAINAIAKALVSLDRGE